MTDRIGDWIQTFSGKMYHPFDPRPEDVDIIDIAHHLSNLCRFAGACRSFYSVAQHCVLGSYIAAPEYQRDFLLHDATEAYMVDLPTPIKVWLPDYKAAEDINYSCIATKFGLRDPIPAEVKRVDMVMFVTEKRDIMNPSSTPWKLRWNAEPWHIKIEPWLPERAKREYLVRYKELFCE